MYVPAQWFSISLGSSARVSSALQSVSQLFSRGSHSRLCILFPFAMMLSVWWHICGGRENGWSSRFELGSCSYCPMIPKMDLPSNITWQSWQAMRGLTDSTKKNPATRLLCTIHGGYDAFKWQTLDVKSCQIIGIRPADAKWLVYYTCMHSQEKDARQRNAMHNIAT